MRNRNPLRFGRIEEDEGIRQKKKYEETLKQKKEMLKQEFDHLEEIRKYDELSVQSLNEVKFKTEVNRLYNMRKQREATLAQLNKLLESHDQPEPEAGSASLMASTSGFRSMVNNHHSDPLYQTFSKNLLAKNPSEYGEYILELKNEHERYHQLIENEQGKTDALEANLEEVTKSNVKLQQEIQELKLLNHVADRRFENIEAVQFLAGEKQTISHKNLKTIRAELKEMQDMRKQFRKKQQDKQKEYKKEIYVGEEYVSHNGMKIEEAEMKKLEQQREIQLLEQDEKRILEKRQKSQNILQYIATFQMFERMFMNPAEKPGHRLVDHYEVKEDLLYEQGDILSEELKNATEEQPNDDFDRNELINVINLFFTAHPEGVSSILRFMMEKFWQLTTELQQNNQTYEVLLQEKTRFVNCIEQLEADLEEILAKNQYMHDETSNFVDGRQELVDEVAKIEGVVDDKEAVAYDAGLFLTNKATTTLNIVRVELPDATETKNLSAKNLKCQNLLFNFFLSFSQLLYRAAQTLQIVSENSYNITSMDLNQHVQAIIQFVEQVWQKAPTQQKRKESKPHKKSMPQNTLAVKPQQFSLINSAMAAATAIEEVVDVAQNEQISYQIIQSIFKEVFLNNGNDELKPLIDEASRYFYVQCKQDQLLWLLLAPHQLRSFLLGLKHDNVEYFKKSNLHKLKLNILLPSYQFSHLRQELVLTFSTNFHALLSFYQVLDLKLKDLASELKIYLKEKDPKFDAGKLDFIPVREGLAIKEARQAVSKKMDFYRTGEVPAVAKPEQTSSTIAKIFHSKAASQGEEKDILLKGLVKIVQPEVHAQQEQFLANIKAKLSEEELQYLKEFYHSKLHHKYEPSVQAKKAQDEIKNKQNQRSTISEKDEFDEERDQIKDTIYTQWVFVQEQNAQRNLLPQEMEQVSEKKAQIKEVTDRLYGDRGDTAQTLKTMSMTTGILSDIDKLEKQPSPIEQPFLISNFKLQKKTMHRNLNKELSLPTLHFLKPTSAYFARRQQSQEQLRAMAQKKYDLIESGMAPGSTLATRPATDTQKRKLKTSQQERVVQVYSQQPNVEKFYQRYGSQEQSQQFLGYLMSKQQDGGQKPISQMTLQEFPFQFNPKRPQQELYRQSGGGARPKSILVYPQQ